MSYMDKSVTTKNKFIQNGDFFEISRIINNFEFNTIEVNGKANYFDIKNQDKVMMTDYDHIKYDCKSRDGFTLSLSDNKEGQFLQLKITNFIDNNDQAHYYYFPIFKNVILELKDDKCVAIYLVVLSLTKLKTESVIKVY